MRPRLSSLAFWALFLAYVALLVVVIGFGKDGWWRFVFDVAIVALGVKWLYERWKTRRKTD